MGGRAGGGERTDCQQAAAASSSSLVKMQTCVPSATSHLLPEPTNSSPAKRTRGPGKGSAAGAAWETEASGPAWLPPAE